MKNDKIRYEIIFCCESPYHPMVLCYWPTEPLLRIQDFPTCIHWPFRTVVFDIPSRALNLNFDLAIFADVHLFCHIIILLQKIVRKIY